MNELISLLPPAIAIILVIITRKALISLLIATIVGAGLVIYEKGATTLLTLILEIVTEPFNLKLILGLALLGAFIGIIDVALKKKNIVSNILNSRKKVLIKSWIVGMLLFIDDYFNILLNGVLMNSFVKKYHISREKVALIIHSLGVSSCVLVPFSTWSIFIISLLKNSQVPNAMEVFVGSILYNFYSLSLVLITFAIILFEINVLKLKKVEEDACGDYKLGLRDDIALKDALFPPVILLITAMLLIIALTKGTFEGLKSLDVTAVLITSSVIGIAFAIFYYSKKIKAKKIELLKGTMHGASGMAEAVGILCLAWCLGSISIHLDTAIVIQSVSTHIGTGSIYLLAFLITAGLSFLTSSWTAFGIVIPILIPLANAISGNLAILVAAIISGGVFGDHNSPISSTTIITKAASKIKIMDHFHTQLPYSMIAFLISTYLFFLMGRV